MAENCDHTVGYLTRHYSPEEGIGSTYDLAMEFADDEKLAVYLAHHEMAKDIRTVLTALASGLNAHIQVIEQGEDNGKDF